MRNTHCRFCVALTFLAGLSLNAWADAFVSITIGGFSPAEVTIARSQYVWFTVADDNGPYTVSSPKGYWTPWYLFDQGDGFGMQINEVGNYNYYDAFTWNTGIIHVVNSLPPPVLTVVTPAEGATYTEPASLTFSVDASDPLSGIASVEFYLDTNLLEQVYYTPYVTQVTNLGAGTYSLSAVAHNNTGGAITNAVHITVQSSTPPPMTLSPARLTGNQLQFEVTGFVPGQELVLQATTDLEGGDWLPIETNVTSNTSMTFSRPVEAGNRFFRVVQRR